MLNCTILIHILRKYGKTIKKVAFKKESYFLKKIISKILAK